MSCQRCNSERVIDIYGKTSDLFGASISEKEYEGYVPFDLGVGGGDDISFRYCADCGQIQGTFPLPVTELEQNGENEEEDDEWL